MARSPNSVRGVLRKVIARTSAGPDFRFSFGLRGSILDEQKKSDDNFPVLLPSNRSDDPPFPAFAQSSHCGLGGWNGGAQKLAPQEQRWVHQSRSANSSSFVLQPFILMGSRFASGGNIKDDKIKHDVTPTTPSDGGSTEGAETAVKSVKDWAETAYNGIMDSAEAVGNTIDVVAPQMKTFLEEHPIVLEVSIPVTILTGAWVILPRVLRQIHASVEMGSAVVFQGQERLQSEWAVPYELSVWKAMEYPARLFATLLTGFQVGMLVAPNPVLAQYLTQFWSGGSLLCIVWFLHRWKSNKFTQLLTGRQITKEERERYLAFDKFSSLGLIFIGALGLADAAGVAVSSLLTVGGVGGIATAFAAREILSNLLTGLTLSFSKPFSVGDTIKAGTVEGKVEEVGVLSTRLLTPEKNPIVVPNAYFTSQAIVNKSRAPWKYLAVKIPIYLTDFEKVPVITMGIREMLYRNSQVFLEEDKPQCHIAQFSPSVLELAITCNVKPMTRNEYLLVEQGILVEAARIITGAGATLGGQLPPSENGG